MVFWWRYSVWNCIGFRSTIVLWNYFRIVGGIVVDIYFTILCFRTSRPNQNYLTAISDLELSQYSFTSQFYRGLVQLALDFGWAGTISNYFPNNVIEGMLAGIGLIILKQIPHAIGLI
jgi:MFS superfamily sulfate permease-like transporter